MPRALINGAKSCRNDSSSAPTSIVRRRRTVPASNAASIDRRSLIAPKPCSTAASRAAVSLRRDSDPLRSASELVSCERTMWLSNESPRMNDTLSVRLIAQFRVSVLSDLDESHDLVVAQAEDGVVHPALVEAEPVVMRLAVRPNAESVAVDTHSRPLPQPRPRFSARTYL